MNLEKIKTYVGFAKKMGKLTYGQTVLYDIKNKDAKLVIIDEGAADNTKDKYISACTAVNVNYILFPKGQAAQAIGKPNVRTIAVKDGKLANVIVENLD